MHDSLYAEQRRYIRAEANLDIQCAVRTRNKKLRTFGAFSTNICRRGMFIMTDVAYRRGTRIYVHFRINYVAPLFHVTTEVAWRRMDTMMQGIGLHFIDIDSQSEELIDHYVLKNYRLRS